MGEESPMQMAWKETQIIPLARANLCIAERFHTMVMFWPQGQVTCDRLWGKRNKRRGRTAVDVLESLSQVNTCLYFKNKTLGFVQEHYGLEKHVLKCPRVKASIQRKGMQKVVCDHDQKCTAFSGADRPTQFLYELNVKNAAYRWLKFLRDHNDFILVNHINGSP
ncbi:hypothetical protein H920_05533 [Fukomys damarensis]|uniref:Uncharacterized protein n=1 Tax=Fukomys damarensis TaxID=885580 RepID=A0A091DPB5_FUKDA|nr:hypothetical protein H920_05533 [Fukomys damarensis]